MSYREPIRNMLLRRFPDVSESTAFDCHSNAMLCALAAGYTGMSPDQLKYTMYRGALQVLHEDYQQGHIVDNLVQDRHVLVSRRDVISFDKLDPRFVNYLTLFRRQIYNMRIEGLTYTEIANKLGKSRNNVTVEAYYMRKLYSIWLKRIKSFDPQYIGKIPDRRYYRDIAKLRWIDGYNIAHISQALSILPNYVCQILFGIRRALMDQQIYIAD